MTDDLLSMLETGPETVAQLAADLALHDSRVHTLLKALGRDGLVKKLEAGRWALASYVMPPSVKPRPVQKICEVSHRDFLTTINETHCRDCRRERRMPVDPVWLKPDPLPAAPAEPVSDTRTIVVDGIEYEATSIGSRPVTRAWPDGSRGRSPFDERFEAFIDQS